MRRSDGGGGADQGVDLALGLAGEVAVDERLHPWRAAVEAPSPPMIAQKTMIAVRSWARVIGHRADGVADEPEHVCALAPDQVSDFAADQDEGSGDQRLERDRRLDAADRRVEIVDHG